MHRMRARFNPSKRRTPSQLQSTRQALTFSSVFPLLQPVQTSWAREWSGAVVLCSGELVQLVARLSWVYEMAKRLTIEDASPHRSARWPHRSFAALREPLTIVPVPAEPPV